MSNTTRHIAAAFAWMFGIPLLVFALASALPASQFHSTLLSLVWVIGLVAIFASWSLRDALEHGKSRNVALCFTAAWFVLFVLAVLPYLFATRGLKGGLLASLKFLSLCLAFAIAWIGLPTLFSRLF